MSNELTDVRCSCGDEYPADSYDAGFIAGSGMCQNCDAALTPKDICTCPSGDGSLRHPCPAHIGPFDKLVGSPVHNESEPDLPPLDEHLAQVFETGMALSESVEQAGGDERDLQAEGAQGELLPCPFCGGQAHLTYDDYVHDDLRPMPVVECNACHTWVRAESWNKRAALAQPSPVQAEAERPEVVAYLFVKPDGTLSMDAVRHKPSQPAVAVMTVAQHERIVKAWIERWKAYIELSAKIAAQRDAALARVAELEKQEPVATVAKVPGEDWNSLDFHRDLQHMQPGTKLYAAHVAQAQQLHDLDKQCRDDVARALGLRPNQERGFAWSYLLASIKSCVKASGDSAQAQHSVPEGWKLVPVEPTEDVLEAIHNGGYVGDDQELRWFYQSILAAAPAPGGE